MHRKVLINVSALKWIDLVVRPTELNLDISLQMGQSFNWKLVKNSSIEKIYVGTILNSALALRSCNDTVYFALLTNSLATAFEINESRNLLASYFQLNYSLKEEYEYWGSRCNRLKSISQYIIGARVCNLDPFECLLSFICSANNNIKRITMILDKFRKQYGYYSCSVTTNDSTVDSIDLYSFPTLNSLLRRSTESTFNDSIKPEVYDFTVEQLQSSIGLGYRAKYIYSTVHTLATFTHEMKCNEKSTNTNRSITLVEEYAYSSKWLHSLKGLIHPTIPTHTLIQSELMKLQGVGRKVADCIALFSLQQSHVVPVDVHVYNVAVRDYLPPSSLRKQAIPTLTDALYKEIADLFRDKFGDKAGYAHSLLFAAELPVFHSVLPMEIVQNMKEFKDNKKLQVKELKTLKRKL